MVLVLVGQLLPIAGVSHACRPYTWPSILGADLTLCRGVCR